MGALPASGKRPPGPQKFPCRKARGPPRRRNLTFRRPSQVMGRGPCDPGGSMALAPNHRVNLKSGRKRVNFKALAGRFRPGLGLHEYSALHESSAWSNRKGQRMIKVKSRGNETAEQML